MPAAPLVSVVVIFLDEERFLAAAIESVLGQTYADWELVLVDDGSSDRSAEIAQAYAKGDARIRYVTHHGGGNRGMSASRNRAVSVSEGGLVAFLDGDDVWLPEKLAEQVELMRQHPDAALIYGRTEWWYSWTGAPSDATRDYLYDPGVTLDTIFEPPSLLLPLIVNDGTPPYTCSLLVRRAAYERLGGFEESFGGLFEDQAFFAKAFLSENVYVSSRCWDRYRQHEQSACAVGLRTGELHPLDLSPSRGRFLEWLERYLEARGIDAPQFREPLAAELEPYRYPTAPALVDWVEVPGRSAPGLLGCAIDLPQTGTRTVGQRVHVMGWAIGKSARVEEIELRSGGSVIRKTPVGQRRPDLALAFPDVPEAGSAGFRTSIGLTGMEPLEFDAVAVLEGGELVKLASVRALRLFREQDAERGYPLVSVVMEGAADANTAATVADIWAQTYPTVEVVVVVPEQATADVARDVPNVRLVRDASGQWKEAGLRSSSGELVVFLAAGSRIPPDALAAGVRALAESPGATSAKGTGAQGGDLTLHRRFALYAEKGAELRLQAVEFELGVRAARRQEASSREATLILMYHRVAEAVVDPWGLAVSPSRFAQQLDILSSTYEVVPLARCLEPASDGRRVAITFDDGYFDNLAAAHIASARGFGATFFLAAGLLDPEREFWWDHLARIVFSAPARGGIELELDDEQMLLDLPEEEGDPSWRASSEPSTARQRAYIDLYRRFDWFDHRKRQEILDRLADLAGVGSPARPEMRPLSHDEVAELAALEGVEVGGHTLTHPRLARLSADRQRDEIVGGRARLEEIVGKPVLSFAYPHGTRADYTSETVQLVADAGFQSACIAEGRAFAVTASRFELPRLMVENWEPDEFEGRVATAFDELTRAPG